MSGVVSGSELSVFTQEHHYQVVKQLSNEFNDYREVFLIKDHLGVLFALKKIKKKEFNKGDFQIASGLEHSFIVRTFAMQEIGPFVFVVSEFIEDGDLKHYINSQTEKKKKPNPEIAKILVTQILTAIQYIHYGCGKKILHKDLKSRNILLLGKPRPDVTGGGVTVKLCDFGTPLEPMATPLAETPFYVAPEIFYSEEDHPKYDEKADDWSVGVVLYELSTFRLPFSSISISSNIEQPIARPPEMSGSAWDLLWRVLAGLMEVEPTKRLTCTQALDILTSSPSVPTPPNSAVVLKSGRGIGEKKRNAGEPKK